MFLEPIKKLKPKAQLEYLNKLLYDYFSNRHTYQNSIKLARNLSKKHINAFILQTLKVFLECRINIKE